MSTNKGTASATTTTKKAAAPTPAKKTAATPPARKTPAKVPAKTAPAKVPARASAARPTSHEVMLARVESVRMNQRTEGHFDCFGRANQGYCDQGHCAYHAECLSVSGLLHSV